MDDEKVKVKCNNCKVEWETSAKGAKFAPKNCKKCREELKANPQHKPSGGSWFTSQPKIPEYVPTPEQIEKAKEIRKLFKDKSTTSDW